MLLKALGGLFILFWIIFLLLAVSKFAKKINKIIYANIFAGGILLLIVWVLVGLIFTENVLVYYLVSGLFELISIYGFSMLIIEGGCINKKYILGVVFLSLIGTLLDIYLIKHTNHTLFYGKIYTGSKVLLYIHHIDYISLYLYSIYINSHFFKRFGYSLIYRVLLSIFFLFTFPIVVWLNLKNYSPCEAIQ